jgi:hypothetical protein
MRKICRTCKQEKEWDEFYTRKDTGLTRNDCKACVLQSRRDYIKQHPDIYLEKQRQHAKQRIEKDPLIRVKGWLKYNYKITIEEYDKQFKIQNGLCAICHRPEISKKENGKIIRLAIDHDHKTGKLRGLLCHWCNKGIGLLREDLTLIESALNYMKNDGIWKV